MPEVDPSILAALNEERGVAAASGNNYRTLKLERGQSALVRVLPVQLGPRKTWFARIARHWVGKRPILCVKQTSPDFGGDPKARCPLCDVEAEFSQSRDKEISDTARKMGAFPKWLTYVFVWEITNERGHKMPVAKEEIFLPNEYWVSRDGFKELSGMWTRSLESVPEYGFLDPIKGYDIEVERDSKNTYRHRRGDPSPIDKNRSADEMFEIIDEAMRHVKLPESSVPSDEAMDEAVEKARDALEGRRSRSSQASESEADYDSDRRSTSRRGDDSHAAGREDPKTESRSSRRDTAPARTEARSEIAEPVRNSRRESPVARQTDEPEPKATPAPSRRAAPPPLVVAARAGVDEADFDAAPEPAADTGVDDPPPPVRSAGSTATPSRRAAPPPPARQNSRIDDDPEIIPPEKKDLAPPEPTAAKTPALTQRLSENLRSRVSRLGGAQL